MESKYIALNSALLFWLLGLMAWCFESTYLAWLSGSFSLSSFVFHFQYQRINHMFKKNKIIEATPPAVNTAVLNGESPSAVARKPATTVIASGIRFDGNIIAEGDVDIYGNVTGTLAYRTLTIKKGGVFSGQAELLPAADKSNVVGFIADTAIETKDKIEAQ